LNKTYENNFLNARISIDNLQNFFIDLTQEKISVNLMVHSMGHQLALPALKNFSEKKSDKIFINELFLNAPDFDIKEFQSYSRKIKSIANRITIYCSNNDKAMLVSKVFNQNQERLGSCANIDDIDVINVSQIDDFAISLGHGYYSSRPVLNDIFFTLLGLEAKQRLFVTKSGRGKEKYFLRK